MAQRVKYPRTPHLPWSPGATSDDRVLDDTSHFTNQCVVVTEKMDGENTTIYPDYCHARSIDSPHHVSRDWVKRLQSEIGHLIPEGWRICGENLYATHSIKYTNLHDYFQVFSIWDQDNVALSWPETVEWCDLLGLTPVPVLWQGIWDEIFLRNLKINEGEQEGYVVRPLDPIPYERFDELVAKWVRKNHVQSDQHWLHAPIETNELKE